MQQIGNCNRAYNCSVGAIIIEENKLHSLCSTITCNIVLCVVYKGVAFASVRALPDDCTIVPRLHKTQVAARSGG